MARTLISTGTRFETLASYSRAVVDGDMIYMAGSVGYDYATGRIPADAVEQTEQIFRNVVAVLREVRATLADVLRVRVFLADRADLIPVCEVIGRHFRDIRPANTTVVTALATEEMKVEIEFTARRGSARIARSRALGSGGGAPAAGRPVAGSGRPGPRRSAARRIK
jgi:enamine deaminase RidA (YjgF/YER057c/UK114 family)